jgi:hypothetical protein
MESLTFSQRKLSRDEILKGLGVSVLITRSGFYHGADFPVGQAETSGTDSLFHSKPGFDGGPRRRNSAGAKGE